MVPMLKMMMVMMMMSTMAMMARRAKQAAKQLFERFDAPSASDIDSERAANGLMPSNGDGATSSCAM